MSGDELKLLPQRSHVRGNVALKWMSRNVASVALAAVLAVGLAPLANVSFAEASSAIVSGALQQGAADPDASDAVFEKSEVVYANLSSEGTAEAAYVVNRFDVEKGGTIVDYGPYEDVRVISGTDGVRLDGDAASIKAGEGVAFYQGNIAGVQLPWDISIEYSLDGSKVDADELAGSSGHVQIDVSTSKSPGVDPTFFDSFMLQATFTIDSSTCSRVRADGATLADAGSNQQVAFTVLPGQDAALTVEMDAEGFEMAGMQIVAIPYSSPVEVPDTSGMSEGMEQLADGVSDATRGAEQLAGSGSALVSGADALADAFSQANTSAGGIGDGGSAIVESASTIGDSIGQQAAGLSQLSAMLDAAMAQDPDLQMNPSIIELKYAIDQMAAGMSALTTGYSSYEEGVKQYVDGMSAFEAGLSQLESGSAELASGIRQYVAGVEGLSDGMQRLDSETSTLPARMQSEIDDMMSEFDFPEFTGASFASSKNASVRTVQFVMSTPDIVAPDEDAGDVEEEREETFFDRFLKLFG